MSSTLRLVGLGVWDLRYQLLGSESCRLSVCDAQLLAIEPGADERLGGRCDGIALDLILLHCDVSSGSYVH